MIFYDCFKAFFGFVAYLEESGQIYFIYEDTCPICHSDRYVQIHFTSGNEVFNELRKFICDISIDTF